MPSRKPQQTIPPECTRGYATLAPEFAQHSLNIVAHFCGWIVDRHQIPYAGLAAELQAVLSREQFTAEFQTAFDHVGAWPRDYEFERVILVLCDDSVRKVEDNADGWPENLPPLRRLVIIEFSFQFPPPHAPLKCRFWVSNTGGLLYICKFAFQP